METDDDDLCTCMQGMAAGDAAFLFMFHERFSPKLAWVVRDMVKGMGRVDVLADDDEIDGLVLDACEVIFDRAAGWRTGGALPWNWARMAIRSRVAKVIGHRVVEFDEEGHAGQVHPESVGSEGEVSGPWERAIDPALGTSLVSDLASVAALDQRVALLDLAIRSIGSERNQQICWHYGIQKNLGDPSPSVTIAAMFGVSNGNARQIYHRHMTSVQALVDVDERFASIREIGWFAA